MPLDRLETKLKARVDELEAAGVRKGHEAVVTQVLPARQGRGPRFLIEGEGDKPFLRMNSNSYLGLSFQSELIASEEAAVADFGTGPGAARGAGAAAGRVPRAGGGDDLQLRLCDGHGKPAAAGRQEDGGDQ